MDKQALIQRTKEFMESHVPATRPQEGYIKHVLGVRHYALLLAGVYHADAFVLEMAAYLHDVGAYVGDNHNRESCKIADDYLRESKLDTDTAGRIIACIANHSSHSAISGPLALEDKILRDADGLSFLANNYIEYYEMQLRKRSKQDAIQASVEKVNAMYAKISTDEGKKLGEYLFKLALAYFVGVSI